MIIRISAVSSMTSTLADLKFGLRAGKSPAGGAAVVSRLSAVIRVRKTFRATERCDRGPVAGRRQPVRCLTNLRIRRYAVGMFYLKALSLVALLAIEMPFAASAANPPKMAAKARLGLSSATV